MNAIFRAGASPGLPRQDDVNTPDTNGMGWPQFTADLILKDQARWAIECSGLWNQPDRHAFYHDKHETCHEARSRACGASRFARVGRRSASCGNP